MIDSVTLVRKNSFLYTSVKLFFFLLVNQDGDSDILNDMIAKPIQAFPGLLLKQVLINPLSVPTIVIKPKLVLMQWLAIVTESH